MNLPYPPDWMVDASCIEIGDPDLWFPAKGATSRDARKICAGCDVRQTCADFATREGLHEGIFGGLTALDRRRAREAGAA